MNEVLFKTMRLEYIKIIEENSIDFECIDYCCSEINVFFVDKNHQALCIGQKTAGLIFESFIGKLKQVIDNKLQLHESINENLGFMWNENLQDKPGFFMIRTPDNSGVYWVGGKYKIWSTYNDANPHVAAWLHNDDKGNIIFEVTKTYRWSSRPDEFEDPEFMTYEEFMKDYKPLLRRVIPRDVAIEWLGQAMKVYRGFFSSEENYINMCKKLGW